MRKSFGNQPYCYPQPVFIVCAYNEQKQPNALTAAWGGISDDHQITLCLSNEHQTTENILTSQAFTISCCEAQYYQQADYLGMVSGTLQPDKLTKCGFTTIASTVVNAPIIEQLAICLECQLVSYDPVSCRLVGEIINVSIDERVLDDQGKVNISKVKPIAFDPFNQTYVLLQTVIGTAFQDGRCL